MSLAIELLDVVTQPRFLFPLLFPAMAYLAWRESRIGRLRTQMLAVLLIDLLGFVLVVGLEAQPIDDGLINELQGVALIVVALTIYGVWRRNDWSTFIQGWALVAAVSVVLWLPARTAFALSGGVLIPAASFLYLAWEDRRLAPLLLLTVFRVAVGITRDGWAMVDVLVALLLAAASVLVVQAVWSRDDSTTEVLGAGS